MLQDGLEALFGVCPWQTLLTSTYRFFRIGLDGRRVPGEAGPSIPADQSGPAGQAAPEART